MSEDLTLNDIQHDMQGALLNPSECSDVFIHYVKPSARLSARAHLGIYQESYRMRLQQCMAVQFAALKYALGDELFQLFVDQYIQAYPSDSYSLNHLGQHFACFLEETRPDAKRPVRENWPDFMIELADFEFSLNRLFDLEADDEGDVATEADFDEQLKLLPVFALFQHQFPIMDYYQRYNNDERPELPFPKQSCSIVIRHRYRLGLFDLNFSQYRFLELLKKEGSIDQAKQAMQGLFGCEQSELDAMWLQWRKKWIALGFFRK